MTSAFQSFFYYFRQLKAKIQRAGQIESDIWQREAHSFREKQIQSNVVLLAVTLPVQYGR